MILLYARVTFCITGVLHSYIKHENRHYALTLYFLLDDQPSGSRVIGRGKDWLWVEQQDQYADSSLAEAGYSPRIGQLSSAVSQRCLA